MDYIIQDCIVSLVLPLYLQWCSWPDPFRLKRPYIIYPSAMWTAYGTWQSRTPMNNNICLRHWQTLSWFTPSPFQLTTLPSVSRGHLDTIASNDFGTHLGSPSGIHASAGSNCSFSPSGTSCRFPQPSATTCFPPSFPTDKDVGVFVSWYLCTNYLVIKLAWTSISKCRRLYYSLGWISPQRPCQSELLFWLF